MGGGRGTWQNSTHPRLKCISTARRYGRKNSNARQNVAAHQAPINAAGKKKHYKNMRDKVI